MRDGVEPVPTKSETTMKSLPTPNTPTPDHGAKHLGLILLCVALVAGASLAAQDTALQPQKTFGYGSFIDLAMVPDGQHFLTAGPFGAFLWDLDLGQVIARFQDTTQDKAYRSIAVSPNGKRFAAGYESYSGDHRPYLHVWDLTTGDLVRKLEAPFWADPQRSYLDGLTFSPDSRQVAAGTVHQLADDEYRSYAVVWDADTGEVIHLLEYPSRGGMHSISFSPDGTRIAGGTAGEGYVWLWDAQTGEIVGNLGRQSWDVIVAFSPDGTLLAMGSTTVRLYDVSSLELLTEFPTQNRPSHLEFTADGTVLLVCDGERVVLWQVSTGQLLRSLPRSWLAVITPDGSRVLAQEFASGNLVRVWDTASGDLLSTIAGHRSMCTGLAVSPDATQLLIGSKFHGELWDTTQHRPVRILEWGTDQGPYTFEFGAWAVACSPDWTRVVAAGTGFPGARGVAALWDLTTGQFLRTFEHDGYSGMWAAAFSPDGTLLLTGGENKLAQLWEVDTGQPVRTFYHSDNVCCVAFSPDGTQFASGSGQVRLWDVEGGLGPVRTFGPGGRHAVAFSPDGSRVLADDDLAARLWDVRTAQLLQTLEANHCVQRLAFSPDGSLIATGGQSLSGGTISLWDAATGQRLMNFVGHPPPEEGSVWSLAFLPDGSGLISGNELVKLWSLRPDGALAIARAPGNRLVLTWSNPAGQEPCRLEQSSHLTAPDWSEVTLTEPDRYEITDPPPGTTFYRLRQP